jgi:hypothetical protein
MELLEKMVPHPIKNVDVKEANGCTKKSKDAIEKKFIRSKRKLWNVINRFPSVIESEDGVAYDGRKDARDNPFKFEFRSSVEDLCREKG